MSDLVFHKNCFTSRSTGYKYRTLSTNTGKRRRRDSKDENTFERKFRELQHEITSRIEFEMDQTQEARDHINEKFEKIEGKIDSLLELQEVMKGLKKDLREAESNLATLILRVHRLDTGSCEEYSLNSKRSMFQRKMPIMEIIEDTDSIITHI